MVYRDEMVIAIKPGALLALSLGVLSLSLTAPGARAQALGHGGLGSLAFPGGEGARLPVDKVTALSSGLIGAAQKLAQARLDDAAALVRAHPDQLELDERGNPVVRGAVLAVAPEATALDRAAAAGFDIESRAPVEGLDLAIVTLRAPPGMTARAAIRRLRKLDPHGRYDYDSLYAPSGAAAERAAGGAGAPAETSAATPRIAMVDTGVDATHPALASSAIEQRAFAPGGVRPAAHGTAVASLMVGETRGFRGVAPGARLAVADIFGEGPTGGATDMLVRALGWLATRGVGVINVSLVGPPNGALGASVKALQARGVIIVAPVGNDGPAAPLAYPASYPGVVAVAPVDASGRVLFESGRAGHLDFAAPGAELRAARPGGGYVTVRGSSFAAPIVAADLALAEAKDASTPATALASLARRARRGSDYGRGLVEFDGSGAHATGR